MILHLIVQLLLVGLLALLGACSTPSPAHGTDPWAYSTPEQQGFDSEVLIELLHKIDAKDLDIHSIVLMRNDHVFFEFYKYPYGPETRQHTMSVGKSVLSALVGIALENGHLSGLHIPMLDSFPEYQLIASDPRKLQITLLDALSMQAGLDVSDDNEHILSEIRANESWIGSTWAQDVIHPPGQTFNYSSFVSHLIAQVTQRAVGRDLMDYARRELFDPIGIGGVQIERDPEGHWFGAGGLWMTSRDMLRFGRLYLENGRWEGEQIVPKQWVRDSTRNQIGNQIASANGVTGAHYGYQWWVFDGAYAAIGVGGQMILIVPELDFVAVITRAEPEFDLIDSFIFRGLQSVFWELKSNPEAVAELELLIKKMAEPHRNVPSEPPALAHAISGQRFEITSDDAPDGSPAYRAFTLHFGKGPDICSLKLESENGILTVPLGDKGAPSFSAAGDRAQRPDRASRIAASAWWLSDNKLTVDLHEVGYPIKERWNFTFGNQGADVTVQFRGAAQGQWSYVAKPSDDRSSFRAEGKSHRCDGTLAMSDDFTSLLR
ncbi:MAG: beta-lactamase family protein [Gammaproteobacteria bacterium]|nr:beta-lactamase family protein [Gammaproteobacteria bacterium]